MTKFQRDIILICAFLLIAAALFLIFFLGAEEGAGVVVKVNGVEIAHYSLTQEGEYELNGGTNTLVIKDGKAWISHADCPDHLCVKQGKIRSNGQSIACRPNFLTVTVYGKDDVFVDLIS